MAAGGVRRHTLQESWAGRDVRPGKERLDPRGFRVFTTECVLHDSLAFSPRKKTLKKIPRKIDSPRASFPNAHPGFSWLRSVLGGGDRIPCVRGWADSEGEDGVRCAAPPRYKRDRGFSDKGSCTEEGRSPPHPASPCSCIVSRCVPVACSGLASLEVLLNPNCEAQNNGEWLCCPRGPPGVPNMRTRTSRSTAQHAFFKHEESFLRPLVVHRLLLV